jgi:membrane protein YdbS with pleckstrin-like domain
MGVLRGQTGDEAVATKDTSVPKQWYERRLAKGDMTIGAILTVIFWIIIAFILVKITVTEVRHLGCYTDRQQQCVSPFYRIAPQDGDDLVTLLKRVENGIRQPEEGVTWRRNLVIAIVVALLLSIVYNRGWPSVGQFLIATLVVYFILFSLTNWYDMHWWYRVREQQLRTVEQLRFTLDVSQQSTACGVYGPSETRGQVFSSCS